MSELPSLHRPSYGDRYIYQPCDREELELTTDLADELLVSLAYGDGQGHVLSTFDNDQKTINRSFSYMESGLSSGWMWPLTETGVAVSYTREAKPSKETYRVEIVRTIHQKDIVQPPMVTIYTIEYFGKNSVSAQATMSGLNFDLHVNPDAEWEDRAMTRYDCETLFTELGHVWNLQQIQEHEEIILKDLA